MYALPALDFLLLGGRVADMDAPVAAKSEHSGRRDVFMMNHEEHCEIPMCRVCVWWKEREHCAKNDALDMRTTRNTVQ